MQLIAIASKGARQQYNRRSTVLHRFYTPASAAYKAENDGLAGLPSACLPTKYSLHFRSPSWMIKSSTNEGALALPRLNIKSWSIITGGLATGIAAVIGLETK